MKVLVVWYDYFHYLNGITRAFNQIDGVQAIKFPIEYFKKQSNWLEKTATKAGIKCFEQKYYVRIRGEIKTVCQKENVDAVIFLNANYRGIVSDELLEFFRDKKIKPIIWFVDTIKNKTECHDRDYLKKFARVYSFEKSDIPYIQDKFDLEAIYLPLGVDDSIYNNDNITVEKEYDVFFVGAGDKKRYALLEAVAKYCHDTGRKMLVYGRMWTHRPALHRVRQEFVFKRKYPHLHKMTINRYIEPEQVAALYKKSKINLNMLREEHNGVNPRIFEILATQGFEITEYNQPTAEIFEPNDCLAMYKSQEELLELIEYYLNRDEERENIAKRAHKLACERYLITKFVKTIVANLKND